MPKSTSKTLFLIVLSQFACTSVWFAVNAVFKDIASSYSIPNDSVGFFTSVIQFGFISGTLLFAFFNIADRFLASKVFMGCAVVASLSNFLLLSSGNTYTSISILRFITGISLAGIYPIGIKIASDFYKDGLGKALGFLVGTLVLGTAIPHFFNFLALKNNMNFVIGTTSILCLLGGLIIGLGVPKGKYSSKASKFKPQVIFQLFSEKRLRNAAFGYFGHMWELYTLWAFTPLLIETYNKLNNSNLNVSLWSFIVIVSGFFSCIVGGFIAEKFSSLRVAQYSLLGSGICILLFPLMIYAPVSIFLSYLILWGMLVIADSPQLSTLVAKAAPQNYKGTAITLVNSLGFLITIISIQIFNLFNTELYSITPFFILLLGPIIGFTSLKQLIVVNNK